MGVVRGRHETAQGLRLLDGRQVLALEVLHQGDLGGGTFHVDARDGEKPGLLGRGETPLPRHEIDIARVAPAEEDGLEDADLFYGCGQFLQALGIQVFPGLIGVRFDVDYGQLVEFSLLKVGGHKYLPFALLGKALNN